MFNSSDFKNKRKKDEQSYAKYIKLKETIDKYKFFEVSSQNNNCAYCTKSEIDLSFSFHRDSLCNNCLNKSLKGNLNF
jgi:hypothetical protein